MCSCVPERLRTEYRTTRGIKSAHQDLSGLLSHREGKKEENNPRITPINSLMDLLKE